MGGGGMSDFPWDEVLYQSDYWLDRNMVKHPIAEMTTSHLRNAIPYAENGRDQLIMSALRYADQAPDGAAMEAERGANQLMFEEPPLITALKDELRKRSAL